MQTYSWVQEIERQFAPHKPVPTLSLSLIIPSYNCSERIATTLESIARQKYPQLEIIVVDAGSTDKTLDVVGSFSEIVSRVYTVDEYNLPEMMNRGISLVTGEYVTFLYPGSFYLSSVALLLMAEAAEREKKPDLLYSGTIQKEVKRPAKLIQKPFDRRILVKGEVPGAIVACWFRIDLFDKMGKFNTHYHERAVYDFFCRFSKEKGLSIYLVDWVFVDFDYGPFTYGKYMRVFHQTWTILVDHFGFMAAMRWFLKLPSSIMLKGLVELFKQKFFRVFFW